jgi:hypothetical protein
MAKSLASKKDGEHFGKNEYELRDRVPELGAKALEIAANEGTASGSLPKLPTKVTLTLG